MSPLLVSPPEQPDSLHLGFGPCLASEGRFPLLLLSSSALHSPRKLRLWLPALFGSTLKPLVPLCLGFCLCLEAAGLSPFLLLDSLGLQIQVKLHLQLLEWPPLLDSPPKPLEPLCLGFCPCPAAAGLFPFLSQGSLVLHYSLPLRLLPLGLPPLPASPPRLSEQVHLGFGLCLTAAAGLSPSLSQGSWVSHSPLKLCLQVGQPRPLG
mmetsp:Transcript_29008/g.53077  ORF Transcript_29008/g.53077 Transcript_29008/m.53077 type:complete len:208 (+) Transcript_29008:151-774(+)